MAQEKFYITDLEGDSFRNAVYSTAEYNDIEIADWFAEVDSLVDIAERFNYVFDENGDMIVWRGKK